MKELLDLKRLWDWCASKWGRSFGCVALIVIAFWFGMVTQEKMITDDCKFVGAFRDGPQAYSCQVRVK